MKLAKKIAQKTGNIFVFLEILSCEGGIQSYVRDIFQAYQNLTNFTEPNDSFSESDILLLRDGKDCKNPYQSKSIKFHYFKSQSVWLGRLRLGITLLWFLLKKQPKQVFLWSY